MADAANENDFDSIRRRIVETTAGIAELTRNLPNPGHEPISGVMEREQIADMMAASEARSETKLERIVGELRGDIRALDAKISALPGRWELIIFLVATVVSIVGLMIAVLSYGGDRLSTGAELSAIARAAATDAVAQTKR